MATPITGTLYVDVFTPTGNPGEYTFANCAFVNQSDVTGNGAFDIQVGMVIYAPAVSLATAMPITGVVHRYALTQVSAGDTNTLSGTVLWDEQGAEEDAPGNGVSCMLAEVTPTHKLALLPADQMYPDLAPGSTVLALRGETKNIVDGLGSGGSGGASTTVAKTYQFNAGLAPVIAHNMNCTKFSVTLWDSDGNQMFAGITKIDANSFSVNLIEAMAGSVDVVFNLA